MTPVKIGIGMNADLRVIPRLSTLGCGMSNFLTMLIANAQSTLGWVAASWGTRDACAPVPRLCAAIIRQCHDMRPGIGCGMTECNIVALLFCVAITKPEKRQTPKCCRLKCPATFPICQRDAAVTHHSELRKAS